MAVVAIVGGQWGDEGKGKIIDLLAEKAKIVARFSGGDNAGHTVINPHGEFRLHLVPSGIFNRQATCIIGNGVAINPAVLLREMDDLRNHGVATDRLLVSAQAHLILPYHTLLDELAEGTTHEERLHESYGIMSDFYSIGNNTILVTHNHSLVDKFMAEKRGQSLMAAFDGDAPTYTIAEGLSRASHAARIAEKIGFSPADRQKYLKDKGYR